jgi:hypothetical protein
MLLDSPNLNNPPTMNPTAETNYGASDTVMEGDANTRLPNPSIRSTQSATSAAVTAASKNTTTTTTSESDSPSENSNPSAGKDMNTPVEFTFRDVLFHPTIPDFYSNHSGNHSLQRLINSFRKNFHAAASDKSKQKTIDKIVSTLENGSYRFVVINESGDHEVLGKSEITNKVGERSY